MHKMNRFIYENTNVIVKKKRPVDLAKALFLYHRAEVIPMMDDHIYHLPKT